MNTFRSRWLALFGGVTLIALSMSGAMAHDPADPNHATDVSGFVESQAQEAADETETSDAPEVEADETAPSDHGACVAEVAHSEDVGGENENHGGAVSEAAQVTCQEDANVEEPTTEDSADDQAESEVEADDANDAAEQAETNDADASDASKHDGEGHGGDKGGDSSDD